MTVAVHVRRALHRLRWRKCRHCGQPVYSFRLRRFIKNQRAKGNDVPQAAYGVHWAHVYGEAHCGAPCSRWRRCNCTPIEEDE